MKYFRMVSKLGSALLFFRFWFEYIWFQAWKFAGIFEKQAPVPTEVLGPVVRKPISA